MRPRRRCTRSLLSRAARDIVDIESAAKGPEAYAKRRGRRVLYRRTQ
jgi:hypothetical protein